MKRSWAASGDRPDEGSSDNDAPNILIYATQVFDEIFSDNRPIIIGCRGSGKTSIVAALLAKSGHEEYFYVRNRSANTNDDIYVFINSWDHLDQLVNNVGQDSLHSIGSDD